MQQGVRVLRCQVDSGSVAQSGTRKTMVCQKGEAWQTGRAALLLIFICHGAFADIYTGTTVHGVRWFSDTPPASGEPYQQVRQVVVESTAAPGAATSAEAGTLSSRSPPGIGVIPVKPKKLRRKKHAASSSALASTMTTTAKGSKGARSSKAANVTAPRTRVKHSTRRVATKVARQVLTKQARDTARREKQCQRYDQDLRKIHAQLRAGYTAAQGRKLRMRRHDLKERQFTECSTR